LHNKGGGCGIRRDVVLLHLLLEEHGTSQEDGGKRIGHGDDHGDGGKSRTEPAKSADDEGMVGDGRVVVGEMFQTTVLLMDG
jgi:hypothetical protein